MPDHPDDPPESVAPRYSSPQPPWPGREPPAGSHERGGPPVHLVVPLAPERDLGAAINHTIRPSWSSPASLVRIRQVRRRDDQPRIIIRGERGCVLHRTQRRVRAIGADDQGLIGAHFPPRVKARRRPNLPDRRRIGRSPSPHGLHSLLPRRRHILNKRCNPGVFASCKLAAGRGLKDPLPISFAVLTAGRLLVPSGSCLSFKPRKFSADDGCCRTPLSAPRPSLGSGCRLMDDGSAVVSN